MSESRKTEALTTPAGDGAAPGITDAELQGMSPEQVRDMGIESMGLIKAFNLTANQSRMGRVMAAYRLNNTTVLRGMGHQSFRAFCEAYHLPRQAILQDLRALRELGEEVYRALDAAGVSQRKLLALAALPPGERPEVRGKLFTWNGKAYDSTKPRELEAFFDDIAARDKANERALRKAEKEMAEAAGHGEKQIKSLRGKLDRMGADLRDMGLTVDGKAHPAVDLVKMAREHIVQAVNQLRAALAETKKAKPEFRAQVYAEVNGAGEAMQKMADALVKDTADALDD